MDIKFQYGGVEFVWASRKVRRERKHDVGFAEAATVFDDPLLRIVVADRNDEARDKAIGFSAAGRLLAVVHGSSMASLFESFQLGGLRRRKSYTMINERLKQRLRKDRPSTTITMRIPVDVVDSLKKIAPTRGFSAYQTLLKSYISEGLRRDEALSDQYTIQRLAEALRRRGVKDEVLREAIAEAKSSRKM
jgi:uncharacterized DUF497 family protein